MTECLGLRDQDQRCVRIACTGMEPGQFAEPGEPSELLTRSDQPQRATILAVCCGYVPLRAQGVGDGPKRIHSSHGIAHEQVGLSGGLHSDHRLGQHATGQVQVGLVALCADDPVAITKLLEDAGGLREGGQGFIGAGAPAQVGAAGMPGEGQLVLAFAFA